jgi:acylphosphatase
MTRRTYHFSGRVQGVGFRYTATFAAKGRPVTGYVRNLPDGRVEMVLEGSAGEMDAVIETIRGHLGENISGTNAEEGAATGEFQGFRIRR